MNVNEVCRLCLATDDLVHIFDQENEKLKMNEVISITTGIEINMKDIVSQKVCARCYQFSIEMFQFRGLCLKADQYLKEAAINYVADNKYCIPNTKVSIERILESEVKPKPKPVFIERLFTYKVHPSVIELSRTYPEIKLPRGCVFSNVTPVVLMELDQVENYFKRLKLDFDHCAKDALMRANIPLNPMEYNRLPKACKSKKFVNQQNDPKEPEKMREFGGDSGNKKSLRTPSKSPRKIKDFNPVVRSNAKRKLLESPSKEKVTGALSKNEDRENNSNKTKKRKLVLDEHASDGINNSPIIGNIFPKKSIMGQQKKLVHQNIRRKTIDGVAMITTNNSTQDELNLHKRKSDPLISNVNCSKMSASYEIQRDTFGSVIKTDTSLNEIENIDYENLTSVGKSVPLYICEICNSVQYNMYELKKHQNKHTRCQFCKLKFRTVQIKNHHIKNVCAIKKMMNELPDVCLMKLDHNIQVRNRYSHAFTGFAQICTNVKRKTHPNVSEPCFHGFPGDESDIIEVSDDDIRPLPSEAVKGNALIIPDVTIDGSSKAVRALKDIAERLLQSQDSQTQTALPSNDDIKFTQTGAVLKNFKPHLFDYKVPVKLNRGPFGVSYDYDFQRHSRKSMNVWNDLAPIDIATTDISVLSSTIGGKTN